MLKNGRCRRPCGIRRRSEASRLLGSRVRIPLTAWMSVSFVCCLGMRRADHSSRGVILSVCVCECDIKTATMSWDLAPQKKCKKLGNLDLTVIPKIVCVSGNCKA